MSKEKHFEAIAASLKANRPNYHDKNGNADIGYESARELQHDYTSVEWDGETFWAR